MLVSRSLKLTLPSDCLYQRSGSEALSRRTKLFFTDDGMIHLVLPRLSALFFSLVCLLPACAEEQLPFDVPPRPGRYTPQHHQYRPGQAGEWALQAKPILRGYFQPVRVELPSKGTVAFFTSEQREPILSIAPAQAGMLVGRVYRFRIAEMPEYPGVELYPTVELLSRTHPPTGREDEFPIPVQITTAEIEAVLGNQMVNKVIYLEQPQLASPLVQNGEQIVTYDIPGQRNLLDAAGQLGRPMLILRLGGRQPDPQNPYDDLLSATAPVRVVVPTPAE